jgi:hypothetical protein
MTLDFITLVLGVANQYEGSSMNCLNRLQMQKESQQHFVMALYTVETNIVMVCKKNA